MEFTTQKEQDNFHKGPVLQVVFPSSLYNAVVTYTCRHYIKGNHSLGLTFIQANQMPVRYAANNCSTSEKLVKKKKVIIMYIHSKATNASKISCSNEINLAKRNYTGHSKALKCVSYKCSRPSPVTGRHPEVSVSFNTCSDCLARLPQCFAQLGSCGYIYTF